MITREEALCDIDSECPLCSHEAKIIVNEIYYSRGTCRECKYYDTSFECCESPIQKSRSEEAGLYYVKPGGYCADFERKVK
jgi:hypothetical protein